MNEQFDLEAWAQSHFDGVTYNPELDQARLAGQTLRARYQLEAEYQSAMWKVSGVDEIAVAMTGVPGSRVYGYRFDWDEQPKLLWLDFAQLLGACHAMEIPFVFVVYQFRHPPNK